MRKGARAIKTGGGRTRRSASPALAARFAAGRHPREGAGPGGVAVDGCVPNVDVEMSRQRHWPLPEPRAAVLLRALAVCCVRLDRGACPDRRDPSVVEEQTPIAKVVRTSAEPAPRACEALSPRTPLSRPASRRLAKPPRFGRDGEEHKAGFGGGDRLWSYPRLGPLRAKQGRGNPLLEGEGMMRCSR